MKRGMLFWFLLLGVSARADVDVVQLVTNAIDQTRGLSSYSEMTMVIKRPTWQRTSSLIGWTRGREEALIRFTAPARDAGNALLKQGEKIDYVLIQIILRINTLSCMKKW